MTADEDAAAKDQASADDDLQAGESEAGLEVAVRMRAMTTSSTPTTA